MPVRQLRLVVTAHNYDEALSFYRDALGMAELETTLLAADLFVSIGTSGSVYPAAGFVQVARSVGAATLELNLVPSEGSAWFDQARHGPASELVPAWVDELIGGGDAVT